MESTPPLDLGESDQVLQNGIASEKGTGPEGSCSEGLDPRLDFLSDEFDPVKVLRCSPSKVHLPHPSILPCDNLQIYLSVVQGTSRYAGRMPDIPQAEDGEPQNFGLEEHVAEGGGVANNRGGTKRGGTKRGVAGHEGGVADPDTAGNSESRPSKRHIRTVLDFMQSQSCSGPFSILQQSWVESKRVKVLSRHCAGVRGVCIGRLIAFDRHMNLVLGDVEEWWTPFRTVTNGGITLSKNQRRRRNKQKATSECTDDEQGMFRVGCGQGCGGRSKWERYQYVKQLFLRGDNVILVSTSTATS